MPGAKRRDRRSMIACNTEQPSSRSLTDFGEWFIEFFLVFRPGEGSALKRELSAAMMSSPPAFLKRKGTFVSSHRESKR